MKKLSTIHRSNHVTQTETPTTQFPVQTMIGSQPKGLHSRDRSKPIHLDKGAAEAPHTKPVGDLRRGSYPGGRKQP